MPLITFLSDTHNKHRKIPQDWFKKSDWIIHSGDISGIGKVEEVSDFLEWFSELDYEKKIFIAGNHDKLFEKNNYLAKSLIPDNVIYLEDSGVEIDGIKIWGSPVSPTFGYDWAFNKNRKNEIEKYWDMIPNDTNILVLHTPPYGYLDLTLEGFHVGCEKLLEKIKQLDNLKVLQFGHIHESRGCYIFDGGQLFINSSILNRNYNVVNKPFIVDTDSWKIIN